MSKNIIGITVNGIEEECRWSQPSPCPRHMIHKGNTAKPVKQNLPVFEEQDTVNPMAVFDSAYDENLELTGEGFIIDDEQTLNDLGEPQAEIIEVLPSNNYAVVKIFYVKGDKRIINTMFKIAENDNYMSLQQLKTILDNS